MTSLQHLLPGADESVRCADHSRRLAIDPGGTAIRADRVVLVEVPLPWPKPVADHPVLAPIAPILERSVVPTRTLAYVGDRGGAGPESTVLSFDRVPGRAGVIERRFPVASPQRLVEVATGLATDDTDAIDRAATARFELETPVALICTHGSHDVCCGSEGARFASEAEAIGGLQVYRVSHTGGHRFAPTAMTLPDGRMWADLDTELLRHVLSRTGNPADYAERCRGWWGADPGPGQVAERAVFATQGWEVDGRDRTVEVCEALDGAIRCIVTIDAQRWEVVVAVARTVPTIACRQPGGLPVKEAREYEVVAMTEIGEAEDTRT